MPKNPLTGLSVVFLGSGSFSVPILTALHGASPRALTVVTRPDRPRGRSRRPRPTPVKEAAEGLGLDVLQPERVNAPESVAELRGLSPELLVVAAYGQILSGDTLGVARKSAVNVHPSLLPRYRGAAPIQWALLRGETETGVTVISMTEEVDAGLILARQATPIGQDENAGELEARLAPIGAELLVDTLEHLDEALDQAQPQGPPPTDGSAMAPRLTKSDGLIDWTRAAEEIRCKVRAFTPWPGAYSVLRREGDTRRMTLLRVKAFADDTDRTPGVVVQASGDTLRVQTGAGVLDVRELQPAGGRPMPVSAFLRGHVVREGDSFVGRQ